MRHKLSKKLILPLISIEEIQNLKDEWEDILGDQELSKDLVWLIKNTIMALKYLEKLVSGRFK